ncbi:hypothetical protein [Shewanella gelidii]|uniref:Orphan protein n=1 Tax=Shewanella gelidii TaxID=1642821 RepID=A0A917N9J3_9GAMM|nr:hypothetical protein [Shewanella gelidii]MCL1097648.1 hypothetical protein [Shewanella gelidii]GGI79899.1 hypothetical protein GCM10009332_16590 [Shewanella gelidii]
MTSIQASQGSPLNFSQRQPQALSNEQKSLIEETLKGFDPENLTQEEALSITETFADAGIQPGRELAELMSTYEFDAKAIGDKAGNPPPPQPLQMDTGTLDISEDMLETLNNLINEYYSDSLSEQDRESQLQAIKEILDEAAPENGLINTLA